MCVIHLAEMETFWSLSCVLTLGTHTHTNINCSKVTTKSSFEIIRILNITPALILLFVFCC